MDAKEKKTRIAWIDCAKGIAIILVIIGHTTENQIVRGLIYSFHMPLFFIMSALTTRFSASVAEWKSKIPYFFKKLVIPGIVLFFINQVMLLLTKTMVLSSTEELLEFIKARMLTLLWASAIRVNFKGYMIDAIGMLWFLFALFFGKNMYDLMQLKIPDKYLGMISFTVTAVGAGISEFMRLPLSFDIACASILLFYVGNCLKKVDWERNFWGRFLLSSGIWIGTYISSYLFLHFYLDMAKRWYPLFPLCYVTAYFGTVTLARLCLLAGKQRRMRKPITFLQYVGRNSMILFCIHALDMNYLRFVPIDSWMLKTVVRVLIDLLLLVAIKKVYKLIVK